MSSRISLASLRTHTHTRVWRGHVDTDTDDTDHDYSVGGLGFYSHKSKALTHNHWVDQVTSAGGFNVHDTQAGEASHKTNMGLASRRVRHGRGNTTQGNMHQYLRTHTLFREVTLLHRRMNPPKQRRRAPNRIKQGVSQLFHDVHMCGDLTSVQVQQHFLHRELRIARVELLDLLCSQLGLPRTNQSYSRLQCLKWTFGHKLTTSDGPNYWATDSKYLGHANSPRRDIFLIEGTEEVAGLATAYCCEAIAFVQISGFQTLSDIIGRPLPAHLTDDCLYFVIGRWLTAHSTSLQRDSMHRPVCPGPLRHNQCLWTYSKTPRPRKTMVTPDGMPSAAFNTCRDMFGSSQSSCAQHWREENHAYYALILTDTIITTLNITREYIPDSDTLEKSDVFLETVTIV